MNMNETVIIPVIMAMVELIKGLGLPKKFSAVASIIIGALLGVFFVEPQCIRAGLFKGIVYGLTAAGLYSGTKNTYEQVRNNTSNNTNNKENKI